MDDNHEVPERLLLATDLCSGCDRPLDRAKQLALEWQARLAVLMVRVAPETPEEVSSWLDGSRTVHAFELAARDELADEFAGTGITATLHVAQGEIIEKIMAASAALPDALVVIGATRNDTFQQALLGSTAVRLAQDLAQPLLVVRQRTRGRYARIMVANDLGPQARTALETALRLFPDRRITLCHVLERGAAASEAESMLAVREAQAAGARFLDGCALDGAQQGQVDTVVVPGTVVDTLAGHAAAHRIQLLVMGVRRSSLIARVFKGSRSDDLMRHLSCDILLVREAEGGEMPKPPPPQGMHGPERI